jgi:hypothetical protein
MKNQDKDRVIQLFEHHAKATKRRSPARKSIAAIQVIGNVTINSSDTHTHQTTHNHPVECPIAEKIAANNQTKIPVLLDEISQLKSAVFLLQNQAKINPEKRASTGEKIAVIVRRIRRVFTEGE